MRATYLTTGSFAIAMPKSYNSSKTALVKLNIVSNMTSIMSSMYEVIYFVRFITPVTTEMAVLNIDSMIFYSTMCYLRLLSSLLSFCTFKMLSNRFDI